MRNRYFAHGMIALFGLLHVVLVAHAEPLAMAKIEKETDFFVLCYHDVQDDMRNAKPGVLTISSADLIQQFAWLREHNYSVISLDDLAAARAGLRPLPAKAVLLSFDDGYESIYSRVLPLLRLFDYSAVVALVTNWMEAVPGSMVNYGNADVPRERFLNWPQVNELLDSGLIELASHSHDLHHGVMANPQGNNLPAASSRIYDAETADYETDAEYTQRLHQDLKTSTDVIYRHTGTRPRAIVWPYGAYNQPTREVAEELGMDMSLTLDDGPNRVHALGEIRRNLIGHGGELADIIPAMHNKDARRPERVVHVDLDYVYDPNPAQQERNLGMLVERIHQMKVSTVYLQAFADPDGDGAADALYFKNRHMPVRADLFGRAAWQLHTRAGVQVYAWMPVLAYHLPPTHSLANATVQSIATPAGDDGGRGYHRLSPFNHEVERVIGDIYADLARYTDFAGLLFHDDALLGDFEDASAQALQHYSHAWGMPADIGKIRADHDVNARWAKAKTSFLVDFTTRLAERARRYRPAIKTARNIYARVVLHPEAESWLAQSYQAFLNAYDYTVIMAMPGLENIEDAAADAWLKQLVDKIAATPGGAAGTVFELQAKDWRNDKFIPAGRLGKQMRMVNAAGIYNFGYYPDDFLQNRPALDILRPSISLDTFPYRRTRP